jgi:hypothetical protein
MTTIHDVFPDITEYSPKDIKDNVGLHNGIAQNVKNLPETRWAVYIVNYFEMMYLQRQMQTGKSTWKDGYVSAEKSKIEFYPTEMDGYYFLVIRGKEINKGTIFFGSKGEVAFAHFKSSLRNVLSIPMLDDWLEKIAIKAYERGRLSRVNAGPFTYYEWYAKGVKDMIQEMIAKGELTV